MKTANEEKVQEWFSEFQLMLALTDRKVTDYVDVVSKMIEKRKGTEEQAVLSFVVLCVVFAILVFFLLLISCSLGVATTFWYFIGNFVASAFKWPAVTIQQAFVITVLSVLLSKAR
jgi:hypothetical protein